MFDIMIPHGNGGKMALTVPCVAVRGSTGISLGQGPPSYEPVTTFPKDDSKLCRVMLFSPDGRYFAWTNETSVKIVLCNTWKIITEIKKPKVSAIQFSSKGTYFMTWEPFIATLPNLHIWKTETNELVKSFIQKKQRDWEPQWSSDEKICGILMGADVIFYEDANFEKIVHRINIAKVAKFSIAPNNAPYHILCYVPGKSGQPSLGRLFQYPKFESTQALASKSFFQADRVDIYWNQKGTNALLMTSTEIDKASYYGKQTLHYVSTKRETAMVMLSKEGPIYSVQWSPKNTEFCVVYGFMPAKATLFNLKCEPIFEFGALHRNSIYYNPHGNIMILAGFGNLSGGIQLWDVVNKKLIAEISAPDTTLLEWSPDGEHFMTATTAPRLRMGNGFKIWHYSGTLLYERPWNKQEELWEVLWQTFPLDTFKEKPISYKAVEGIAPSQPQASKQVYRPPSARGQTITFKLHDDDEFGPKPNTEANPSKAALKAKKKREAKKAKKELEAIAMSSQLQTNNPTTNGQISNTSSKYQSNVVASSESDLIDDPEKQKKIKRLKSKLDQISKLKEQLSAGKQLEINQLDKIKKEAELIKELEELIL
ncbi:eukaryotic translation initiation factor 2A-like isoform X2 [Vespa mandarinia]|uniref:eukaryotic translation initiation factor 2A-like isoform X2 n=1 Tax=Vespa mandarinia TaxID=7446 RepID=UPI0016213592|nr:eukaryotic translation initiation factor 2A-like isoform X2 [Vespa mandarinia]XP_046818726.1 eukaryotic translation initiation factor 2A isoform X2 [Vespa crabro]